MNSSCLVSILITALLSVATTSVAQKHPNQAADRPYVYPFAMCSNPNFLTNPAYPEKFFDTGAKVIRLDLSFAAVRKNEETDPDKWNWEPFEQVKRMKAQHPDIQVLAILGYGTPWAADPAYADVGKPGIASPQRGIDVRPVESPENLYGQYVYEAVRRYKDVIDAWESWNEPDLNGHHYFKGNGADFMPYQRTFYLAAKKADPDCVATFAGICFMSAEGYLAAHNLQPPTPYPPKMNFFEEYLQAVVKDEQAAANAFYFDIMNFHTYSRASDCYDYASIHTHLMQHYLKQTKPLWITEMGMTDKGGTFGGTEEEYCDYVLQSYAWGVLGGVERFFHFQLDNSNGHGLYSGMLGEPKPALTTYRDVLVAELKNTRLVGQLHGHPGVGLLTGNSAYKGTWRTGYNAFEFQSLDGRHRVLMAFADKAEDIEITLPAKAGSATLVDRHNRRSTLQATDGVYRLTLKGATNVAGWPSNRSNEKAVALGEPEHLIGGATVLLVETLPNQQ